MAQAIEATRGFQVKEASVAHSMDRSLIDRLISWAGAVVALALVALGAAAIYGGSFALDNVRDRLEPQNITFPPAEAMSPEEKAEGLTVFAGQKVDTGTEAEAFSRYIGGHISGTTYSEASSAARAYGEEIGETPTEAEAAKLAEMRATVDTQFKGEMLRGTLLNAYGWWTVGQITFYAGIGMVIAGLVLALLVAFGFRHARKAGASSV